MTINIIYSIQEDEFQDDEHDDNLFKFNLNYLFQAFARPH